MGLSLDNNGQIFRFYPQLRGKAPTNPPAFEGLTMEVRSEAMPIIRAVHGKR
jgi:hypothetical protein